MKAVGGVRTPDLILGPYVTGVSDTAAKICWVAPPKVAAACQFLGDSAAKVEIKTSPITGRDDVRRTATVTGRKPAQTHTYLVTSGTARVEGSFQTAPAPGSRSPFTFLVMSDTQSNGKSVYRQRKWQSRAGLFSHTLRLFGLSRVT